MKNLKRSLSPNELFEFPPPLTTVVNLSEQHYDVRIDRKTKWGNPFLIGVDGTRQEVIALYAEWIKDQDHLMKCIKDLKGKKLGCWCKPKPCHGDVLVRLANES